MQAMPEEPRSMRITVLPSSPDDGEGTRFAFDRDVVRIGRRRACDVRLPDRAVSLEHARIVRSGGALAIVDDDSTNGTFVAGRRLRSRRPEALRSGDVVVVGPFRLLVEMEAAGGETSSEQTASFARRMMRGLTEADRSPYVEVASGPHAGARLRLDLREGGAPYRIGRAPQCELALLDADASREHVHLLRDFSGVRLCDLDSKNGVRINGRPAAAEQRLRHGDRLHVGTTQLRFFDPVDERLDALAGLPDAASGSEIPSWRGERAALVLALGSLGLCAAFWVWWAG
jgi:pSer/pThr/pTyr-binding forkhead associated (FHA) protein